MTNLVNIKKWHDGLLSGQYPQGTGTLVRDGRYCCLGVAVHLAIEDGVTNVTEVDTEEYHGFRVVRDMTWHETDILPLEVRYWLGITSGDPELLDESGHRPV